MEIKIPAKKSNKIPLYQIITPMVLAATIASGAAQAKSIALKQTGNKENTTSDILNPTATPSTQYPPNLYPPADQKHFSLDYEYPSNTATFGITTTHDHSSTTASNFSLEHKSLTKESTVGVAATHKF